MGRVFTYIPLRLSKNVPLLLTYLTSHEKLYIDQFLLHLF